MGELKQEQHAVEDKKLYIVLKEQLFYNKAALRIRQYCLWKWDKRQDNAQCTVRKISNGQLNTGDSYLHMTYRTAIFIVYVRIHDTLMHTQIRQ